MELDLGTEVEFGTGIYSVIESGEVQDGQWPVRVRVCLADWLDASTQTGPNTSWQAQMPGSAKRVGSPETITVAESPVVGRDTITGSPGECSEYWVAFETDVPGEVVYRNPEPYNTVVASWRIS
jgi:hypothetical protein